MPRYFLELSYKGTRYIGFQVQENANSVQAEVEKAFEIYFRKRVLMTGSSRTDTGVHALQNYFHFDLDVVIPGKAIYNLNSILPADIVIRNFLEMPSGSHCRFDAISREYRYYLYQEKNPFMDDRAFFYPYKLNLDALSQAAGILLRYSDYAAFSKRNTQAKTSECSIQSSEWVQENGSIVYQVRANRFLRGMVRGLTGTMIQIGRGKTTLEEFESIIQSGDNTRADFAVPARGLFLCRVNFSPGYLPGLTKNGNGEV